MIINKNQKSPVEDQFIPIKNKIHNMKSLGSQSLRATLVKFKNTKQRSFLKDRGHMSNTLEEIKPEQNSFCEKNTTTQKFFTDELKVDGMKKALKPQKTSDGQKETFKEFIRRIQMYNKNKLIHQMQLSHQKDTIAPQNSSYQQKPSISETSKTIQSFAQKYDFDELNNSQKQMQLKVDNQAQKQKKIVIHQEKGGKGFYNREYRRSKTQQEIKLQMLDHKINSFLDQCHKKLDDDEGKSEIFAGCGPFLHAPKKEGTINHVSLKLMQHQKLQDIQRKSEDITKPKVAFSSSVNRQKLKQKDLSKHNRFLQTKFSKIRIRLGSSFYNKNLQTIEHNFTNSRQDLHKKYLHTIGPDEIFGKSQFRDVRISPNSSYCEQKIMQAQNVFIQKRRLVPTASQTKERQPKDRRFFKINSPRRHVTSLDNVGQYGLKGWDVDAQVIEVNFSQND